MNTKICPRCDEDKSLEEFSKRGGSREHSYKSWCKDCHKLYGRKYASIHKERQAELRRIRFEKDPDLYRNNRLKKVYGISLEQYDDMLEAQDNMCFICEKTPEDNGKRLGVDHNHITNEVRGLLCDNCNTAIGLLQDDPELCTLAAEYLRSYK